MIALVRAAPVLVGGLLLALPSRAEAEPVAVPAIFIRGDVPRYALATLHGAGKASLVTLDPIDQAALARQARGQSIKRVVLFVPGYNTRRANGIAATHRLQQSFGAENLVVYVDWGSYGKTYDYEKDAKAARRASPSFRALLVDLHEALRGRELDVFAHSMGTRIVADAMATISVPGGKTLVKQAVLAAPDLSLSRYARSVARNPEPFGHVTIYASRDDRVLMLSTLIHFHRRLGRITHERRALARTDVVDATVASRGYGHGYALHDPGVMRDIAEALAGSPMPHPTWKRLAKEPRAWTYQ